MEESRDRTGEQKKKLPFPRHNKTPKLNRDQIDITQLQAARFLWAYCSSHIPLKSDLHCPLSVWPGVGPTAKPGADVPL